MLLILKCCYGAPSWQLADMVVPLLCLCPPEICLHNLRGTHFGLSSSTKFQKQLCSELAALIRAVLFSSQPKLMAFQDDLLR